MVKDHYVAVRFGSCADGYGMLIAATSLSNGMAIRAASGLCGCSLGSGYEEDKDDEHTLAISQFRTGHGDGGFGRERGLTQRSILGANGPDGVY